MEIVVGGDIMLSRGIGRWAKTSGYDRVFTGQNYQPLMQFPCYMSGDCLLIFNLESPFAYKDNDQPRGGFLFRANPANIQTLLQLKQSNQLLLSLANNHISNAGGEGFIMTRELLDQYAIRYVGAGVTPTEARMIKKIEKS